MARLSPLMALPPVIFAGFAVMAYLGMYRGDPNALPSTFIGQPAPPLPAETLAGFPAATDADLRSGEVTVVNFWASWCPPCHEEFPHLQTLHDEGVPLLAISLDDPGAEAAAAQAMEGYSFPWVHDQSLAAVFHIASLPSNVVYDEGGRAVYSSVEILVADDVTAHF